MKRAILSDVHGNLEALEAVLDDLRAAGAGEIWCLGDLVGYGPDPERCVEILRDAASVNLMGNHDAAVAELTPVESFNINARRAVEWTRSTVSGKTMEFLKHLPLTAGRDDVFLVHASPRDPQAWDYIMGLGDARANFRFFTERACCVGHTHLPLIAVLPEGEEVRLHPGGNASLREGSRYLVNVGSVGQPRDHDPRAAYLMLDTAAGKVEIRRVPYAVEKTQRKMREAGLPSHLSERLTAGR